MKLVYTLLLGIAIILLFWLFNKKEGFETLQDKLQDRANPLAAISNPLQNPATAIGIPESVGSALRNMGLTAFNSKSNPTQAPVSQRIDNENSFLGMIQFCKNNGSGENPFTDPKFNANCGVCMSSGTLLTGETFTTPTGVLVYPEDKKIALADKKANRYPFPHVVASLNAATCAGASMGPVSEAILAITEEDLKRFKRRAACEHKASFDAKDGCAMCLSNKSWAYVDPTVEGPSVNLLLWGLGVASVKVGGKKIGSATTLDLTNVSTIELGPVLEGTNINVDVKQASGQVQNPYLYGAIQTILPSGNSYSLDIGKFLESDSVSNRFVRRGLPKSFDAIGKFLDKLMPATNKKNMSIHGSLPLTFIEEDNIASINCSDSPFVTSQDSYNEMVNDDPCTNPVGQAPGNYEDSCLRKAITEGGCSAAGTWYQEPSDAAGSMSLADFKRWLSTEASKVNTDPDASMGCSGVDISTPCDAFVKNPKAVPDAKCMAFLYSNNSQSSYIGSAYPTSKSQAKGAYNFCKTDGAANPTTPNGATLLSGIASSGYNGKYGLESIKNYLSDMFNKATNNNLNPLVEDALGGNKTSLLNCLNVVVTPPPPPPIIPPPPPPPPPAPAACKIGPSQGTFLRHPNGYIGWNPTGTDVLNPVGSCTEGACPSKPISACGNFTQLTKEQFAQYTLCQNYFDCSMIANTQSASACQPIIKNNTNIDTSIPLVNGGRGDANFPGISDINACITAARNKFPNGPLGVTVNPANNKQCWAVPMTSSGPGITTATGWQSAFLGDPSACGAQPAPSVQPTPQAPVPPVQPTPVPKCLNDYTFNNFVQWTIGGAEGTDIGPPIKTTKDDCACQCSASNECLGYSWQKALMNISDKGDCYLKKKIITKSVDSTWGTYVRNNPPPKPACPDLPGTPVNVSAGKIGNSNWSRWGAQWESGFPANTNAFWISFPGDVGRKPNVSGIYNNTTGNVIDTILYFSCDDAGTLFMNGKRLLEQRGSVATLKYKLQPGCTRVDLVGWNDGGPSGLVFAMVDLNNNTLFQTNSSWKITHDSYVNWNPPPPDPSVCSPQMIQLCSMLKFRPIGMQILDPNITKCC